MPGKWVGVKELPCLCLCVYVLPPTPKPTGASRPSKPPEGQSWGDPWPLLQPLPQPQWPADQDWGDWGKGLWWPPLPTLPGTEHRALCPAPAQKEQTPCPFSF